jgi:hypothetical protein
MPADVALTLLAGAVAIGLSPYGALAAVGLSGYLQFVDLPPSLAGLATPLLWSTLGALTIVDGLLSHFRLADIVWNAVHTIVRPLSAFLLASAILALAPQGEQWLGSLAALVIGLLVHISVFATRTSDRTAGPAAWLHGFTTVRLFSAAAIGVLAFAEPSFAASVAAVLLLATLASSDRLWGAAALALSSVIYVLTRPDHLHEWKTGPEGLPRRLRRLLDAEFGDFTGPVRHARVTLARFGPRWSYHRGRLFVMAEKPVLFVHRHRFRPRVTRLAASRGQADHRPLVETVEVEAPVSFALCLGPDAPPGPAILTELQAASKSSQSTEL